jgi:hypothetical protein
MLKALVGEINLAFSVLLAGRRFFDEDPNNRT